MSNTFMPRDNDGGIIPVLGYRTGGAHKLAVAGASGNAGPFFSGTKVVSLYADGPLYFSFGAAGVTASVTDHFLPPGTMIDVAIGGQKRAQKNYLAAIRAAGDCTLYISERE